MPEVLVSNNATITPSGDPPLYQMNNVQNYNYDALTAKPVNFQGATVTAVANVGGYINKLGNDWKLSNNYLGAALQPTYGWTQQPTYYVEPNYTPYDPYNYGPVNYGPVNVGGTSTITLECPHCKEQTELTSTLACTKCFQALVTLNPYTVNPNVTVPFTQNPFNPYTAIPFTNDLPGINYYPQNPAIPKAAPIPAIPAKPKEPDAHPGDGSRWEEI